MIAKRVKSDIFKIMFFSLLLIVLAAMFLNFKRIMIPFGVAYILALMLRPIQKLFYSVDLRKKIIGILMLFTLGFVFSYPLVKGIKTLTDEAHKVEYYIPKLEMYLRDKYSSVRQTIKKRFNYDVNFNPVDSLLGFAQESTKSVVVY